jgi:hypothetical protein
MLRQQLAPLAALDAFNAQPLDLPISEQLEAVN